MNCCPRCKEEVVGENGFYWCGNCYGVVKTNKNCLCPNCRKAKLDKGAIYYWCNYCGEQFPIILRGEK